MEFHLEFGVPPFPSKIKYTDRLFFTGSCFAENIGGLFTRYKFNTHVNPNGIVYDPLSIARALTRIVDEDPYTNSELFLHHGLWHSWEHHSSFSSVDEDRCLEHINQKAEAAKKHLSESRFLFITFGSSYVYRHKGSGNRVANCHKADQKEFQKELLTVDEIVTAFKTLGSKIGKINPDITIVYTVSPVRYIRDGVVENTLSKSVLIQAVHELAKDTAAFYFPAYELVMDDLRDYRFFKSDLVHPNEQAIQYVFDKLCSASFTKETESVFSQVGQLVQAMDHRPFEEASAAHKKFKETFLQKCMALQEAHPTLDLSAEIRYFRN